MYTAQVPRFMWLLYLKHLQDVLSVLDMSSVCNYCLFLQTKIKVTRKPSGGPNGDTKSSATVNSVRLILAPLVTEDHSIDHAKNAQ